jgi:hypothetical protein
MNFSAQQVQPFYEVVFDLNFRSYNHFLSGIVLSGASAPSLPANCDAPVVKVLQTPGSNARISTEWRPSKLLCKRFNVPDPFFGRAETSQREQSGSNRMSKSIDTAALLGISSHSVSASVDVAALERLAAALKQTADEDNVKHAASHSLTQLEAPKMISTEKMAVVPEATSDADPLPRAPDDLFASIFGLDEDNVEDVELPPAVVPVTASLTKEPTVAPISNDELAKLYSTMSKGSGPVTSSLTRTRKFASSWDEAPQATHTTHSGPGRHVVDTPFASALNNVASDATSSASNFLKTMSSDAYDGFLPSIDELQRDSGASFKLLKSRDSINTTEHMPSWRSKLAPASEPSSDASISIKNKVDIKMQALTAAREALISASASTPSQPQEISDVMHGPSLPPPGSAWAGPSWQPKPVSWGSAPAVRGSQPSVAVATVPAQPSHQNVAQFNDSHQVVHHSHHSSESHIRKHSSKHKHLDSSREHKSKSSGSLSADAAARHRHHRDDGSVLERNHSRDDRDSDKVKAEHKHRHRHSDDGGDRSSRHHRH